MYTFIVHSQARATCRKLILVLHFKKSFKRNSIDKLLLLMLEEHNYLISISKHVSKLRYTDYCRYVDSSHVVHKTPQA